jgi:hypothetical protein
MENDYQKGYRQGFLDGFHAAENTEFPAVPSRPLPNKNAVGCVVCGMDFSKGVWGYVCPRSDCPTRITSSSFSTT